MQNGYNAKRFRLSMGHFCWAAGNIFTQHNARCKLEHHCSFGLKFNVLVDFLLLRSWLISLFAKFSSNGVAKTVNKIMNLKAFLN